MGKGSLGGGGREESSDNELSIETKAELNNFISESHSRDIRVMMTSRPR